MPKNIFHSTVTKFVETIQRKEGKDLSWPRFICYIILWIKSLILDMQIMFLVALVNTT